MSSDFEVSVHWSSGIDTKRGDICSMMSSWRGAEVTQDMATVIWGREDFGLDWNARVRFDQSTMGFMLWSQGRPRTIRAKGWSWVTRRLRVWVDSSENCTEVETDWWMNPDVAGLPSKRLSVMGWANTVDTNIDIEAQAKLMKFEVVPESIRVGMGSGTPWIQVETKKDVSDWEVRVASREEEYTGEIVCRFAMWPKVHTWLFGSLISFLKAWEHHWGLSLWRPPWEVLQR